MRLASYVPGELIPLPLSGSIPELPHVAKGFLGWRSKFFNWCLLFCNSSKPKLAKGAKPTPNIGKTRWKVAFGGASVLHSVSNKRGDATRFGPALTTMAFSRVLLVLSRRAYIRSPPATNRQAGCAVARTVRRRHWRLCCS